MTLSSRFIFIVCATILILSAVEGINGFKKLNIKDIGWKGKLNGRWVLIAINSN